MQQVGFCVACLFIAVATVGSGLSNIPGEWADPAVEAIGQGPELRMERRLVRAAQSALRDRGFYDGPVDGLIGPQTREAVRNFQRFQGLPVTGRLDEATLQALEVKLEQERSKDAGVFGKIGASFKAAGEAMAQGAVISAKATAKGATTAGKATAKGATTAGKAMAEGSTVAAEKTAQASTTAGKATAKGATTAGKAIKGALTPSRSDADILHDIHDRFKENPQINQAHFDVGVSDGVVTLIQRRGTAAELSQAAAVAKQVKGVKKVVSKRQ